MLPKRQNVEEVVADRRNLLLATNEEALQALPAVPTEKGVSANRTGQTVLSQTQKKSEFDFLDSFLLIEKFMP